MRAKTLYPFLILAAAVMAFSPVRSPAQPLPPQLPLEALSSLSAEEVAALKDAYERRTVTPGARRILEDHPELLRFLPPEAQELLRATEEPAGEEALAVDIAARPARIRELRERVEAAPPRFDWKRSLYVSRLFFSRLLPREREQLSHFGHELFDPSREIPLPGDYFPVPDEYVVGPGDEIVARLWGRMEGVHRMRVDRDGKIFFPKFGSMYVAGKAFGDIKKTLQGKVGSVPEVSLDVSFGQIKGFPVSVLGEVASPGRYQVSSFHTALQAISVAGGIREIGSLRRVRLMRGGKAALEIDIYDFLLKGDVTRDISLRAGDSVFVPVAGPLVAVAGEVRRQAIYELKEERTIGEVLAMAGGLSPSAFRRRVQLERLEENRARIVLDLNLDGEGAPLSHEVRDGDILRIFSVLPEEENVVRVEGNVHRPGKYEWKSGLTVMGLIPDETFFLPETFFDYAVLTRLVGPEKRKEAIPVDLRRIVVERDPAADVALQPRDTLTVYNQSAFREKRKATVGGEVRKPGEYEILPGMRVSDLVKLGGDLTRDASREEAELSRVDGKRNIALLSIDLGKALEGDEAHDLFLQDRDILMVKPVPDLEEVRLVTVTGEVRSPGVFAARKGERLSSILQRAGGYTGDAFLKGAVFTRVSVQKRQQELIDRTVEQLEQDIARTAAKEGAAALDTEDIAAQRQILEARRALLGRLKQVQAQGRVIIRLSDIGKMEGTMDDLLVENGDRLVVSRKEDVVNVLGRVYNPTAVVYDSSRDTAGYYLRKVGGPTEDADRKHIFVVKADGSVVTKDTAGENLWFFGSGDFLSTRVEPGDAIVVPERLVYTRLMKDVKDITQILYQIAVTAGVLIVAF